MTSILIFLMVHLFSPSAPLLVQGEQNPLTVSQEIVLSIQPPLVNGGSVKLGYKIPYPGYVEFRLYGPNDQKIWRNSYVRDKGLHYQTLNGSKLESGVTYKYEFYYKGKAYPGKFTNS